LGYHRRATFVPSALRLASVEIVACPFSQSVTDLDPLTMVCVIAVPDDGHGHRRYTSVVCFGTPDTVSFYSLPEDLLAVFFCSNSEGRYLMLHCIDLGSSTHLFLGVTSFEHRKLNDFFANVIINGNVSDL
jgi:hypothetical protein